MGISERIAQMQAKAAAIKLAEEQEAQRRLQEAENVKLQAQVLAAEHEAERKKAIITELSPILEVVKAREQLESARDTVWQIGEVDPEPTPILSGDEYFKQLSLRLRAPYNTVESYGEGEVATLYPSSDAIFIDVIAGNHGVEDVAGVWVSSGLSEKNYYYSSRHLEFAAISLEEPDKAHDTLEEMLARACIKLGNVEEFWNRKESHFKQLMAVQEPIQRPTAPKRPGFLERIFGPANKTSGRSGNPPFYGGPVGNG